MALSTEDKAWIKGLLTTDKDVAAQLQARPWQYGGRGIPANLTTLGVLATAYANAAKAAGQDVDESAIVAGVLEGLSGSTESDAELAAALQAALGDRATAIGRILATAPQSPVA